MSRGRRTGVQTCASANIHHTRQTLPLASEHWLQLTPLVKQDSRAQGQLFSTFQNRSSSSFKFFTGSKRPVKWVWPWKSHSTVVVQQQKTSWPWWLAHFMVASVGAWGYTLHEGIWTIRNIYYESHSYSIIHFKCYSTESAAERTKNQHIRLRFVNHATNLNTLSKYLSKLISSYTQFIVPNMHEL